MRQRIILSLKNELHKRVVICNPQIYPTWDNYISYVHTYGVVIEGEPIETLGYVDGLSFVDPMGNFVFLGGNEVLLDDKYQAQAIILPQSLTPMKSLENATKSIVSSLHAKFNLMGHISVRFVSSWDGLDNIPRLAALSVLTGISPAYHAIGNAAIIDDRYVPLPKCLVPLEFPKGKLLWTALTCRWSYDSLVAVGLHVINIPIAFHRPLKGARDDVFMKLSCMKGISFDKAAKTGTIFHHVDSIISGHVSLTTISPMRRKTIFLAITALEYIIQQYGRADIEESNTWEQVTSISGRLKALIKEEDK